MAVRAMVMETKRARAKAESGMATATKWARARVARGMWMVTRVAGDKEGNGKGS